MSTPWRVALFALATLAVLAFGCLVYALLDGAQVTIRPGGSYEIRYKGEVFNGFGGSIVPAGKEGEDGR